MQKQAIQEATLLASALWIAGPTACGKSRLAMQLAKSCDGEIISVDSMQVYMGMDIGTAKTSKEEQSSVRHHMIDLVKVTESFDVAQFRKEALAAALDIAQRGKLIIFCGGTGFYFRALLQGLGKGPPSDPVLRQELNDWPIRELCKALESADPETYASIDRSNKRKLVRALEVVRLTGQSFSSFKPETSLSPPGSGKRFWFLERAAPELRKRIDDRVDKMIAIGWIDEVQRLMDLGLREGSTASQAIGYGHIMNYLRGCASLDATIDEIKKKTWQYAKRQRTWFRHQICGDTIDMTMASPVEHIRHFMTSIS
jgi:tRNA dimethylallyltransferase